MSLLTTLFLTIPSLILPTLSMSIATYDEAGSSKIQQFVPTNDFPATKDFLINTFCYCAPIYPGGNSSHYYQTDYFNTHDATTYIITSTCLAGHNCHYCSAYHGTPKDTCDLSRNRDCTAHPHSCSKSPSATDSILVGTHQRRWERRWFHLSWKSFWHARAHDHLVYWPDWRGRGKDWLEFNGMWRDLSEKGGMGMKVLGVEEAEGVCERACWEQVHSGVERGAGSRQVVYEGLRNICYGCKQ